jgi:hypothetical protein
MDLLLGSIRETWGEGIGLTIAVVSVVVVIAIIAGLRQKRIENRIYPETFKDAVLNNWPIAAYHYPDASSYEAAIQRLQGHTKAVPFLTLTDRHTILVPVKIWQGTGQPYRCDDEAVDAVLNPPTVVVTDARRDLDYRAFVFLSLSSHDETTSA